MKLNCEKCGGPIGRQRGSGAPRMFCEVCSPKRVRPDRVKSRVSSLTNGTTEGTRVSPGATSVYAATKLELGDAGVVESVMGQCALILARHIDADQENGSGLASLVKAHREAMAAALQAAPRGDDALTRLRRQRGFVTTPSNCHG